MEAIKLIKIGAHKSWEALLEKHKEYVEEIYAEDVGREDLINSRILFGIHLKKFGTNPQIDLLVEKIAGQYEKNPDLFRSSVGAIFISSEDEEYTKQTASILEYKMNKMGLRFLGRPIVEAPEGLNNYNSYSSRNGLTPEQNLEQQFDNLIHRLQAWSDSQRDKTFNRLLVLHSSNEDSNTLELWRMARRHLGDFFVEEIFLGNGEILDCKDCGYKICKHFAKQKSCFYGGIIVEEVYPSIAEADIVVILCPNYNDALTANISAMINRLTALFRNQKFYDKKIYAVIVSGSSGTEAVGTQLIRALNMNKTFQLPPHFSLSAIANDKGSIHKVEGIHERAKRFAEEIILENLQQKIN